MITAKEAYQSLRKFVKDKKVLRCYLCDDGYIFVLDMNNNKDNALFVKETGGVRPFIPDRDIPKIIKEKEASEYLDI